MCGIAGILSKDGNNVVKDLRDMLSCMLNRGPDGTGIVIDNQIFHANSLSNIQGVSGNNALGHLRLEIVGGVSGKQPLQSCDGRVILEHNGEIYNYKEIKSQLIGNHEHNFATSTDSEVIVHLLEDNLKSGNTLIESIRNTVKRLDGVYVLAIKDNKTGDIALVRDKLGVRQIYYAEDNKKISFASEKKALWKIGIKKDIKRVRPAHAILISFNASPTIKDYEIGKMIPDYDESQTSYRTMSSAVHAYKHALINAMKKRTQDLDRVGIIFSGGIDSVLIAWLAKYMVKEVICYTAGIKNSSDVLFAQNVAKKLNLPIRIKELSIPQIEIMLPKVISTIEDNNTGQVEVAIPIFAASALAHDDGIKVMYSGQGADELFGGYSWYPKILKNHDYKLLQKHMMEDLLLLYKETLEREDKITMAHSIEMREPYLDKDVIQVALQTNIELNVSGPDDIFCKHVHRNLAVQLGIPYEIAYRKKEAAQHGSGIHDTMDVIAKAHGFTEINIPDVYSQATNSREKVGSSQRYGYLYENGGIWMAEPHVQRYLESISEYITTSPNQLVIK